MSSCCDSDIPVRDPKWPVEVRGGKAHRNVPPPPAKENPLRPAETNTRSYSPLFRYPGGKRKLLRPILTELLRLVDTHKCYGYREPFFGGGAVGLNLLARIDGGDAWLNDLDRYLGAIWVCVQRYPEELKAQIQSFVPTVETFREFKADLLQRHPTKDTLVNDALKKIVLHQTSYSGLGTMAGGPLGGKCQKKYKVDDRWSPTRLIRGIDDLHRLFSRFTIKCTSTDFCDLFAGTRSALLYLDPPYYRQGPMCYEHSFNIGDHQRLASVLQSTKHHWVLSYDDCQEIRQLYCWARIRRVPVTYTLAHGGTQHELLITKA